MSKRSKKIIYVILAIVIIVGILAINILIPAPNPTNSNNDVNDTTDENDTNQEETKDILYKYNINDFDYSNLDTKIFSITVTTTNGGKGQALINLYSKDNSCYYQISINDDRGASVSNSTNCSYNISDNTLTITADFQNIYNPSQYYSSMGYTSNTSYEYGKITTAEIEENWKGIIIDTQTYRNAAYRCALQRGLEKILFNPKSKNVYQLNGNDICHTDGVSEDLAIDVSDYRIVDKTKTNE